MGEGSYKPCKPTVSIGPPPGRSTVHELEGAVEHDLNLDVVRSIREIGPFRLSSAPGLQMANEKQLRPNHATLFGLPHRVRIWGDSEHNILPKQYK